MPQLRTARRNPNVYSDTTDERGRHLHLQSDGLKNTRDLRSLLLDAAYELQARPDLADTHIHLFRCTLAKKRVEIEFEQFKRIAQPQVGQRIFVHDERVKAHSNQSDSERLQALAPPRPPTTASQEAVIANLLCRQLQRLPGVSIADIAAETKASIPTIYKVLNTYAHCIDKDPEDRTIRLSYFSQKDWEFWMQRTNQLSSVYFIDRSGAPRSATRLAKELAKLQRDDLAIGGLMGAIHHLPALDATIPPQLDILVHGTRRADLGFIKEIDPGLEPFTGREETANVVVHFIDRPQSLFERRDGQQWGSLPDCIANMQKARLTPQVNDALQLIRGGSINND
jgi:hypothetical protein